MQWMHSWWMMNQPPLVLEVAFAKFFFGFGVEVFINDALLGFFTFFPRSVINDLLRIGFSNSFFSLISGTKDLLKTESTTFSTFFSFRLIFSLKEDGVNWRSSPLDNLFSSLVVSSPSLLPWYCMLTSINILVNTSMLQYCSCIAFSNLLNNFVLSENLFLDPSVNCSFFFKCFLNFLHPYRWSLHICLSFESSILWTFCKWLAKILSFTVFAHNMQANDSLVDIILIVDWNVQCSFDNFTLS